ncbi:MULTISPECIES: translation initiation factor IF-3 [Legionella]|uniref:Translation initiation factor IF-3 n=1 Tax=Legionella septentrionalis TaxID=2498109 RepID=A0A433JLN6_9GAMM|nr:translation initiation factor IF-3 [Legionella septentrionalis]MCP0914560.1 translation initiation factor IF-3 [Legionella sp. 27cVA30]RUQ90082.1 translation initiation factor IF-3 [Legionella septentrionalis]RUQ95512.1 translation initiation factor IF-3 [Legionella septentrionalis]RUR11292.1 translation initiation factor IF-3 [Legionella septentrionalis]RUR14393.1 translation initiation factor IF-3 [Legionella septentrionalis]
MSASTKRDGDRARINEQINVPEVRLIDVDGNQAGIVSTREALRAAEESGLDLVEISPTAKPPVCRIMDYGKFLFEISKKQAEARKKQKQIQVKELKFRPTTEEGDYQVKLRNLIRFLNHGDKVKITLRFRGREVAHQDIGMKIIERLQQDTAEFAVVEQQAKREGRQLMMVLSPKKTK